MLMLAGQAMAQEAPAGATGSNDQLTEVVVTAQRRVEKLQDVPISAQVIGKQELAQDNLNSVVDLSSVNPSLEVVESGRSTDYYIRGTGSGEGQAFDQSVPTFEDDIYHGRSRNSSLTFLDLDHVEILKGPQSTFFGNNAIAGAINIVTAKPSDTAEGFVRALAMPVAGDSDGQYALESAVNMPLSEDWSLRVAGIVSGERGYMLNVATDEHVPDRENYAGRATLRYHPTEQLDITLKTEYGSDHDNGGVIVQQTNCPPPARFGPPTGFCAINLAAGVPIGLDNDKFAAEAGNFTSIKSADAVLNASYNLGRATITSVTGYTGYNYEQDLDAGGTVVPLVNVSAPENYRQFSQELRLASDTSGPIEYLVGAYFQADTLNIRQSVNFFFLTPTFSSVPAFAPLVPFLPLGQDVRARVNEDNYSAFGSLTWKATDNLRLNAGLRGTIVTKDFDWRLNYGTAAAAYGDIQPTPAALNPLIEATGLGNVGTLALNRQDEALLPSAGLQYQLDRDVMAYASFSRGFKAGGFNVAALTADPANYPYNPEHVNAYEVGLKSELLDRHLLLNLALFRNDFSDLQVSVNGTNASGALISIVQNAAESRAQGVELESQIIFSPAFRIRGNLTYLDSKYLNYPGASPTYDQQLIGRTTQDLSGKPTEYAPNWAGNVTGTLTVPVFNNYRLITEATGIFSSLYYTTYTIDPLSAQPAYGRLDARISLEPTNGRWSFDIIGKNLTNTIIRTFFGYQSASFGSTVQSREQLRNVAFQLRYKF
jgi:iron complex outermembrane receptor protein